MALDIERFKAERKRKGLTQQKLSEMLHVSRGTVAMWEIGRNIPPTEMLAELSEIFNCSVDYLLGKTDTRVDDALLDLVNTIPDDLLQKHGNVHDALRAMRQSDLPSNVRPISSLHRQRVPLIGEVAAGEPIYAPEELGVYVDSPVDADAAITVHGDSMEPTYKDGDLVYIKCCPNVPEGAVAVVFLDDEATLKHVYKRPTGLTLWSDNASYRPMQIEFEDYAVVRVFGVPVGYTRIYKKGIEGKIRKGLQK